MQLFLLQVALALGCGGYLVSPPDSPQAVPLPAWPSAVAVSPDGAWLAVGFVSDPAWVEVWENRECRGVFRVAKSDRTHALYIGNDGLVTVGLSRMGTRTPYVSVVQASADGGASRRCHRDLDGPYIDNPTQWRGVQALAVNGLVTFLMSVEGGVYRVNLGDCSLTTLQRPPAGDAERLGRLTTDDRIVLAMVEDYPPSKWLWSGEPVQSDPIAPCIPPALQLPTAEVVRQRVDSSDCRVSVVRTADVVYRCEFGVCNHLSPSIQASSTL